jgi:hypothetical protein
MRALSASQIVSIWERGLGQPPLDRALILLAAARPDLVPEQLASLAIGRRDACMFRLRESIFGPTASAAAGCPRCFAALEFTIRTADLAADAPPEREGQYEFAMDGVKLRFRLPDSADLQAIAHFPDVETARRQLLERCVIEASRGGEALRHEELPEQAIAMLGSRLAECDPLADISLDLTCSECGHAWRLGFDIAGFLWREIEAFAKRLLIEVHTLARFYGWSEADILAMSSGRRHYYLEMAG